MDPSSRTAPPRAPWVWSGGSQVTLDAHDDARIDFVPPPELPTLADPLAAVRDSLRRPLGAPTLRELAAGAARVTVAIPDASRTFPADTVLGALLDELAEAGVTPNAVTITVGCGAHRTTTTEERVLLAGGPSVAGRGVRLTDSQAHSGRHRTLGTTRLGCPICLSTEVTTADLVVTVGVVEPHLYAGCSGGVKGVAIGCAAEATIAWTHAPVFISRPGVEPLRLVGNPFQQTLQEIAAASPLRFAVNVSADDRGALVAVASGAPAVAQKTILDRCAPTWLHLASEPYDTVVAGIPAPKHASLYQASRAATYLALTDRPALRVGGRIVLCTDLPDGIGGGPGERRFGELLAGASPDELVTRGLRGPLGAGGQRAFVVARALQRYRLAVAGNVAPQALAYLGLDCYSSPAEAIAGADAGRVLVVADAMATIVRLQDRPCTGRSTGRVRTQAPEAHSSRGGPDHSVP